MEILTLPQPGRKLFLKARPLLIRGCGLAEKGTPPRAVFGGGTILAARWGHRESKDVDIRARLQGNVERESRLVTWAVALAGAVVIILDGLIRWP